MSYGYNSRNDEYERERRGYDHDGNVERGGYGRDADSRPQTRPHSPGGNRKDDYEDPDRNRPPYPQQNRHQQDNYGGNERRGGYDRDDDRQGGGGYGRRHDDDRNEENSGSYSSDGRGGRHHVGSGETYVGLGNRGGDDQRRTSDAYGGEGLTDNQAHNYSSNDYNGSNNNNRGDYGNQDNRGGSSSINPNAGTYVAGSGEKWKPGQEMHFPASEAKSEANPYAPQAQQLAGDTQGFVKEGLKDLENWGKEKAKELLSGHKK